MVRFKVFLRFTFICYLVSTGAYASLDLKHGAEAGTSTLTAASCALLQKKATLQHAIAQEGNAQKTELLWPALHNQQIESFLALLNQGASAVATDKKGLPIALSALPYDPAYLTALLLYDADPNATCADDTGKIHPLLVWAINMNRPQHVQLLINAGANPDVKNGDGQHVAFEALHKDDTSLLKMLLDKDRSIANATAAYNTTYEAHPLIFWAIHMNRPQHMQLLLGADANPDVKDGDGMHIAFKALHKDDPLLLKMLLEKKPSIVNATAVDKAGKEQSLLVAAVFQNKLEHVKLLLAHGANPNVTFTDTAGTTSPLLWWAIHMNRPQHAQLLLKADANPNAKDGHGQHIAITALRQNDISFLEMLLDKDPSIVNVTTADPTGKVHPLLWWAIHMNRPQHVQLLLKADANPNAKDGNGQHIAITALRQNDTSFLEMLLDKDPRIANATAADPTGKVHPLLGWAIHMNRPQHVQLLLKTGANPNAKDGNGQHIAITALRQNDISFLEMLLDKDPSIVNVTTADPTGKGRSLLEFAKPQHAKLLLDAKAKLNAGEHAQPQQKNSQEATRKKDKKKLAKKPNPTQQIDPAQEEQRKEKIALQERLEQEARREREATEKAERLARHEKNMADKAQGTQKPSASASTATAAAPAEKNVPAENTEEQALYAHYTIEYSKAAKTQKKSIDKKIMETIIEKINAFKNGKRQDVHKMAACSDWRLKATYDYRVIFTLNNANKTIFIKSIELRKDAYKK